MNLEKDSIAFLKAFYSEVKFDTNKSVEIADIAKKIGIENAKHIQAIWENLEQEKYLKVVQQFSVPRSCNITTLGIKKAEEYLKAEKPKNLTKDEIKNTFKQYNRYFISSNDFQAAKKYLEQFQKESNNTIKEALLIAAIISYNRPFTRNDSGDFIISNITTNLMEGLNPEQEILHSKLVDLRNGALAHSTWDFNSLDLDTEGIVTMDEFYILHQGINTKEFLVLSDFMAYECELKSIDLKKKINN